ncbi:acetyl-COA carboxylase [Streptomyces eurocidicus]|uniref:Biotin-dependent 3-methylcrotonyl-coenzyme A carboxylase alpha1 subunit n=1 Tax=Streptomyces eurocidicus TaxID=66423 RepID=A0A2N8P370_STREU|nr:biotin carboxylase N-terminal domain-containing protein [Streptomyces eurocidicus]MBB5117642.1 acetyl-CoA/propionyl-CoA carboxylase biotin carboxyl carrier protein [Streptomyces eurocidicus]MBF6053479.1 ATP-grasp domain-containing protein [Streptomyces eurocidicus]PNE35459.1 acetyl-COA carboxylase [Streptomyces eurocidicus]
MFDTVLVANRGEIAVRVIRTLRKLGIRSVAVFSDADADARHVREADTAVRIGPAAAAESYLSVKRLLDAAARTGAQAVHPGYGFLAENAAFARACEAAGLVFIGPPAGAIELMGDKIRAKETVRAAGVPVVPGSSGSGLTDAQLTAAAREIGMPVLLKPSAGGGGKGMRLVRDEALLGEEIAAARREARGSFGDDTLLVERWVDRPRHIEIQVLADGHGGVLHLGERECSLQRRHQKIVEEAPSVFLDEATRAAMGEAAAQAARSCGYTGAGTVEFIVPGEDPSAYYFMEMNTRLQVEHPVTELVTGLDLVEWQLRVAAGERLGLAQADVTLTGHAVEARVCAETARVTGERVDFLPSAGAVRLLREPAGEGVRVDSGLSEGTEVGTAYDPMLAKVIAYGPDRPTALRRLRAALAGTVVLGVDTNVGFLRRLLAHPDVVSGALDTGLVDRDAASLVRTSVPAEVYAAAGLLRQAALAPADSPAGAPAAWVDPFSVPTGWRLGGEPAWTPHHMRAPGLDPVTVRVRGTGARTELALPAAPEGAGPVAGTSAGPGTGGGPGRNPSAGTGTTPSAGPGPVSPAPGPGEGSVPARIVQLTPTTLTIELDGLTHTFSHARGPAGTWLGRDGDAWHLQDHDPVEALGGAGAAHAGALTAPMPGTVTVVKAAVGDTVTAGQSLLVVEAMKMEHVISAPHDGTVTELDVTAGTTVAMDQVLAVVTPQEES